MIMILISFTTIYAVVDMIFTQSMQSVRGESTVLAINQVNINAENHLKNTENMMNLIIANNQVMDFYRSEQSFTPDEQQLSKANIRSFLTNITECYSNVYGIALINKYDEMLSNELYRVMDDLLITEDWYQKCLANPDELNIIGHPVNRNLSYFKGVSADHVISVVKAVKDISTNDILGVVLVDIKQQVFEQMEKSVKLGESGFTYIQDDSGNIIYSPVNFVVPRIRSQWFSDNPSQIFEKRISGQLYQFIYSRSQYTKWTTVGVYSMSELLQQLSVVRLYFIISMVVISAIAILIFIFVSSSVVRPIRKLRRLMQTAENGDLSVKFESRTRDEVGQLGRSFNAMLEKINNLIRLVYKEQQSKRQAELITLQAQIKPHFLYNTFDTINWMALKYKADDIVQLVNSLTSLFRIGLSKGSEIIHVWEEIEHVRSYLVIQKMRYEDLLEYNIEADEETKNLCCQKLILQPIVENAIYHGIKNKKSGGEITITVRIVDKNLCFTIQDNGKGIAPQKLAELNEAIKMDNSKRLGYGLFNVNERIMLSYGREFGVSIESTEGVGTTVFIRHPIITELEG